MRHASRTMIVSLLLALAAAHLAGCGRGGDLKEGIPAGAHGLPTPAPDMDQVQKGMMDAQAKSRPGRR